MRIVQRQDLKPSAWNAFVDAHPACWWWHREEWISYCLAHSGGVDHSFAVVDGDQIVGLCPLIQEGDQFSMGGDPCAWPVGTSVPSNLDEHMVREIDRLGLNHEVHLAAFRQSPLTSVSSVALDRLGYKDVSWQSQVIDLTGPDLWAGVKDGHRAEIHRGLRELSIGFENDRSGIAALQDMHRREAGRDTRPQATWDMMASWFAHAGLIIARRAGRALGIAYFISYKGGVYYASAAWPEAHVSHAVLWTAMRTFKELGYKQLEMGWLDHPTLAVFKRGFGGEAKTLHCVEKRWP